MGNFYIAGIYRPPLYFGYGIYIVWNIFEGELPEPIATSPYDISGYEQLWYEQYLYGDLATIQLRIIDHEYNVIWESSWQDINIMGYSIVKWNISEIPEEHRSNIPGFEILMHTQGENAIRSDFRVFLANGIEEQDYAFIM